MDPASGPRASPVERRRLWPLLLALLAGALCYANAPTRELVYDDRSVIRQNPNLGSPRGIPALFGEDVWAGTETKSRLYRPLAMTTLALDRTLFGLDGRGFRVTSVLLHLGACAAIHALLLAMGAPRRAAGAATAWFAVHPVHTEAVDVALNRSEILATIFYTLGLAAGLRELGRADRFGPGLAKVALCFALGLLSRESMLTFPIALVGLLWVERRLPPMRRALGVTAVLGAILLGYLVLRQHALRLEGLRGLGAYVPGGSTSLSAIVSPIGDYLRLLVWPWPLRADRAADYALAHGASLIALTLIVPAMLTGAAVLRRRAPEVAFALAWFPLALVPSSKLFADPAIIAERFLYLPSVAVCLVIPRALAALSRTTSSRLTRACVGAVVVTLGMLTLARNLAWRSDEALWRAEVRAAPHSAIARTYLGAILANRPRTRAEAIGLLREAVADGRTSPDVHVTLAWALAAEGRHHEARTVLETMRGRWPGDPRADFNLASVELTMGDAARALALVEHGLAIRSDLGLAHQLRADALRALGRLAEATSAQARADSLGRPGGPAGAASPRAPPDRR